MTREELNRENRRVCGESNTLGLLIVIVLGTATFMLPILAIVAAIKPNVWTIAACVPGAVMWLLAILPEKEGGAQ